MSGRAAAMFALAGLLAGCGGEPAPTPASSGLALRTMDARGACAGVGLDAEVHGDPKDPSIVWLTSVLPVVGQPDPLGNRVEVIWPTGYTAVFDPTLRVLDPSGQTAMEEGDYVDGACVTQGPLLLTGPMDGFRLECGTVARPSCTGVLNEARVSQGRGWPAKHLARFIVRDASGHYSAVFEDGERVDGYASPNL